MVHRLAAVDRDLCQSKKCGLECIKDCPVNINGKECIVLGDEAKAVISEELCIGCGICVKVCPFDAIDIINLSEEIKEDKIHQYGVNSFRLFRLPTLRSGEVVGLVGRNGIGKSTALRILSGGLIPNLGDYEREPSWERFIDYLRGREMKDHFEKVSEGRMVVATKPQAVYKIPEAWGEDVGSLLEKMDDGARLDEVVRRLSLSNSMGKKVSDLSGGELQRVAVAAAAVKEADLYLFDEPSSYNDVYQRLAVSGLIRSLAERGKSVLVVEHDTTFLDYVADYVQVIHGEPGAYGIISGLYASRTGINALLDGYLPRENIRFRDHPVTFGERSLAEVVEAEQEIAEYDGMKKGYEGFKLTVEGGRLNRGTVVGIVGANALGKTTFLKIIAGVEKPDEGSVSAKAKISYKPQYLKSDYDGTVEDFLVATLGGRLDDPALQEALVKPMRLEKLLARNVRDLSGGELQKVAIIATMAQEADIYALDEPSAFLDVEERFLIAKAMTRLVKASGRSAIVIDHDIQVIDLVSDRLLIFSGKPGVEGTGSGMLPKYEGMNRFLREVGLTYRRDVDSGRPRVNKPGSKLDRQQKDKGEFYYEAPKGEEDAAAP